MKDEIVSQNTICIAEKLTLAEAAGKVLADQLGVKPQFSWEDAKRQQFNQVGHVKFFWLDGHAFEQAMPDHYLPSDVPLTNKGAKVWRAQDLPILPEEWIMIPKASKERRLAMIEAELKACDLVWHMGDPDAEGQLLVDECLLYYGFKGPVKRICINDYNTSKVRAALDNIEDNGAPAFREWFWWGLARGRYSWTFGLNGTRGMTLRGRALGFDGLLPVGDVQTPLLYLVRERDRLVENFKPIPYFTLAALVKHDNGSFRASWKPKDDQAGLDSEGRLIDAKVTQQLMDRMIGKPGTITAYSKDKKQEKAPLPLAMDELQMEAFRRYGYAAQDVLTAGQQLYEAYKVMTYPRSDNRYLSEAKHAEAPGVMDAVFAIRPDLAALRPGLDLARKSAAFDDKKMEGTPHHGIIPSIPENPVNPSAWSEIERNVYDLVVRGYLAQFAAPYEFHQTTVEVDVDGELFKASGRTPIAQGWKALLPDAKEDDAGDDAAEGDKADKQTLPAMQKGDPALCEKCEQSSRKTKAPARFDEAMLLDCMKNIHKYVTDEDARKRLKEGDGIGTTATRAPMIQDMKDRELLIPVKAGAKVAKLMTSPAARALIDALPLDVKDPVQAGVLKSNLDLVAKATDKEAAYKAFMAATNERVTKIVNDARTLQMTLPIAPGLACPKCAQGQLKRKESSKTTGQFFWFCTRWNAEPKCDAIYPDQAGKPNTTPVPTIACPCCSDGALRRKVKEKGAFWFCSNWSAETKCEAKFNDDNGKPDLLPQQDIDCPTCKQGKLRHRPGKHGRFWFCSNWNAEAKCEAKFSDDNGKPQLTLPEAVRCPICKSGALRRIPKDDKHFWACSNFKDEKIKCAATYPDQAGRPNFAPNVKRAKK